MSYGNDEVPVKIPDGNLYRIIPQSKNNQSEQFDAKIIRAIENPVDDFTVKSSPKSIAIILDPLLPFDFINEALKVLKTRLLGNEVTSTQLFFRKRMSSKGIIQPSFETFQTLDPMNGKFIELGKTSHSTPIFINEEFQNCELKIAITMVQPHFVSGFTGGPDIILPGAASIATITRNRSLLLKRGFAQNDDLKSNPILTDSEEACSLLGDIYNICVVPDSQNSVASVFAGELRRVFRQAVTKYLEMHQHFVERRADIAITSISQTMGDDLYHAVRALSNISRVMKKDGSIIIMAPCTKGIGDTGFLEYAKKFPEKKGLMNELRYRFKLGAHVNLYLFDILEKYRVEIVSTLPDYYTHDIFQLKPAHTASEAIQKAIRVQGKDSKIMVIEQGDYSMPRIETPSEIPSLIH